MFQYILATYRGFSRHESAKRSGLKDAAEHVPSANGVTRETVAALSVSEESLMVLLVNQLTNLRQLSTVPVMSILFENSVLLSWYSFQIAVGLATSFIILTLIVPFLRVPYQADDVLDGLGFLQIVWLATQHKDITDDVGDITHPTAMRLRESGAVEVTPLTTRRTKVVKNTDMYW